MNRFNSTRSDAPFQQPQLLQQPQLPQQQQQLYRRSSQRRRWVWWLYFAINAERDGAHRMLCFVVNVALSFPCKLTCIHKKGGKMKQTSNKQHAHSEQAKCEQEGHVSLRKVSGFMCYVNLCVFYQNHISRRNSNISNAYQSVSLRTKTIEIHQHKIKLSSYDAPPRCFICVFYQHTSLLYNQAQSVD